MERDRDPPGKAARNVNDCDTRRGPGAAEARAYTPVQRGGAETGAIRHPPSHTERAMDHMLATLPDRAMRVAHQVGGSLKGAVPDRAMDWMQTGAALAALKTGGRFAVGTVRRHPALAATAVAGAGLMWLIARQQRKRNEEAEAAGNGKTRRVTARKAPRRKARSQARSEA